MTQGCEIVSGRCSSHLTPLQSRLTITRQNIYIRSESDSHPIESSHISEAPGTLLVGVGGAPLRLLVNVAQHGVPGKGAATVYFVQQEAPPTHLISWVTSPSS